MNVRQNLRTSGNLNELKDGLKELDEALGRLQARQGEGPGKAGNPLPDAHELLARIEDRLGRREYLLVKLSIHTAILSAKPKSLDTNYVRVNAFDALEHAENIRRMIADAGIANSLGIAQEDLAPLIDVILARAPQRVAQENAPTAAGDRHATYDAALLKELMSDLGELLGGNVARELNLAEKDRWLDELLSSVRSVPIQQKTSVTLVTNGRTPGFIAFVASLLKPALGALGVSFSRSVSYAQTIEIKRGAKQYEVRILEGKGSAMAAGISANAQAGELRGSAGRADVGNNGVCIKFASVEDVQKFLIEMFSEGGVSQETWIYDVKGFENVVQDTELT